MVKTILIDDESLAREVVKHYLKDFPDIEVVAECADGFEALKAIAIHKPDLIFLDVQMPKINGFEVLELLEEVPAVIFTTAFDEYALKAFEVNAIDYLLKPIAQDRFEQAMKRVPQQLNTKKETEALLQSGQLSPQQQARVVVKDKGQIKIIPAEDIHYIEADDDYVKINTQDGQFQKNKTMAYFEQSLDTGVFVRVHRSYFINIKQLNRIELREKDSYMVLLKNGIWLPVSKSGYARLKLLLGI